MDRKFSRSRTPKKRKFRGNRYVQVKKKKEDIQEPEISCQSQSDEYASDTHTPESECPDLDSVSVSDTNTTPTPMPTPSASRSELKLSLVQSSDDSSSDDSEVSDCDQEENCEDQSLSGSRIIDMTILSDNIKSQLIC